MRAISETSTHRWMELASMGCFLAACGGAVVGAGDQTVDSDAKVSPRSQGQSPGASSPEGTDASGGVGNLGLPAGGVLIAPDAMGWIGASSNLLGIHGQWTVFADGLGSDGLRDGACQAAGHADSECSVVSTPDPASHVFPNSAGSMCTSGVTATVLDSAGVLDYPNMWGAGMGFDFMGSATAGDPRGVFNAEIRGVVGVSFDIDNVPSAGLRVAFPTPGTEPSVAGPDYWGAAEHYPSSPLVAGTNVVLFSRVQSPETVPRLVDVTQLEAMQFLLPATPIAPQPFHYCISNVKMLGP